MKTFHIRAPIPRRGAANQFFAVGAIRVQKTLCGAPVTDHDDKFHWTPTVTGNYEPCPECCRIRLEAKAKR